MLVEEVERRKRDIAAAPSWTNAEAMSIQLRQDVLSFIAQGNDYNAALARAVLTDAELPRI